MYFGDLEIFSYETTLYWKKHGVFSFKVEYCSMEGNLHAAIPGGAHTYSRGDDQFPENAPPLWLGAREPMFGIQIV